MAERMTPKENWLRLIRNEQPAWIGDPWDAFRGTALDGIVLLDPISETLRRLAKDNDPCRDPRSTTFYQLAKGQNEFIRVRQDEQSPPDTDHWIRSLPALRLDEFDWSATEAFANSVDRNRFLILCCIADGLFERSQYIMGFEEALCNYMLEPQAVFNLLGAIADWKISHLEQIVSHLQPDVILYRDNWGVRSNLFLPPEVWRRLIKPHLKRIVAAAKSRGVIFMHRTASYCEPLVKDMAQIGIDIWQGAIPTNNIARLQKSLGGRMAIIGGIDDAIDRHDCPEALIRAEVRRCIDEYCIQGSFVPCISNITPVQERVRMIYLDELKRYGAYYARRHFEQGPRRISAVSLVNLASQLQDGSLDEIGRRT